MTELKMLRSSLGVTRLVRIRNEYIRGKAQVEHFGDKDKVKGKRFGHLQGSGSRYILQRMLNMELPRRS